MSMRAVIEEQCGIELDHDAVRGPGASRIHGPTRSSASTRRFRPAPSEGAGPAFAGVTDLFSDQSESEIGVEASRSAWSRRIPARGALPNEPRRSAEGFAPCVRGGGAAYPLLRARVSALRACFAQRRARRRRATSMRASPPRPSRDPEAARRGTTGRRRAASSPPRIVRFWDSFRACWTSTDGRSDATDTLVASGCRLRRAETITNATSGARAGRDGAVGGRAETCPQNTWTRGLPVRALRIALESAGSVRTSAPPG
jgi:hypothetical protein